MYMRLGRYMLLYDNPPPKAASRRAMANAAAVPGGGHAGCSGAVEGEPFVNVKG